jgi:hypothetical protein
LWAIFAAAKDSERLRVYERIHNDSGETWTDVSSWYWSALSQNGAGSWWAITVAEKERDSVNIGPSKSRMEGPNGSNPPNAEPC